MGSGKFIFFFEPGVLRRTYFCIPLKLGTQITSVITSILLIVTLFKYYDFNQYQDTIYFYVMGKQYK